MTLQIYGTLKCQDTKKSIRFFKERGVNHQFINLQEKAPSAGEWQKILRAIPADDLIDPNSKTYKKKNMAYMSYDAAEELQEDPLLARTPIVRGDKGITAGFQGDIWKEWLK